MTADERLEALLNRCGMTLEGLPMTYEDIQSLIAAKSATFRWFGDNEKRETLGLGEIVYAQYILHLTDIIDRMETALENVIGERDWLKTLASIECQHCANHDPGDHELCGLEDNPFIDETGACSEYQYSGVPEEWMADE